MQFVKIDIYISSKGLHIRYVINNCVFFAFFQGKSFNICLIIVCLHINLAITRYTCSHCNLMEEVPVHKIIRYARVCATCGDLYGGDIENCCFCNKKIRDLCRDACGWYLQIYHNISELYWWINYQEKIQHVHVDIQQRQKTQ